MFAFLLDFMFYLKQKKQCVIPSLKSFSTYKTYLTDHTYYNLTYFGVRGTFVTDIFTPSLYNR